MDYLCVQAGTVDSMRDQSSLNTADKDNLVKISVVIYVDLEQRYPNYDILNWKLARRLLQTWGPFTPTLVSVRLLIYNLEARTMRTDGQTDIQDPYCGLWRRPHKVSQATLSADDFPTVRSFVRFIERVDLSEYLVY